MKPSTLTVASLLTIVLLPLHVAGDVEFGFDPGGPGLLIVVGILLVLAIGALPLAGRRLGQVITLLGGIAALAMPVIHRHNGFTPEVAQSGGGLLFIWTLVTLGVVGGVMILESGRGLWRSRPARK